jgi:hypothetical protein
VLHGLGVLRLVELADQPQRHVDARPHALARDDAAIHHPALAPHDLGPLGLEVPLEGTARTRTQAAELTEG